MFGKVIKREINSIGLSYAIIRGTNGKTYYCDDRGMEEGKVEDLFVGVGVEYESYKDKKGKLIATHLKCTKSIKKKKIVEQRTFDDEERERIKNVIVEHLSNTGPIFLTFLNIHLLGKEIDYRAYGYKKPKIFLKEKFSDVLDFDDVDVNGSPQTKVSLLTQITDNETDNKVEKPSNDVDMIKGFNQMFIDEKYEEVLLSNLISQTPINEFSIDIFEKAIIAAEKLLGFESIYKLSDFDKTIIESSTSKELVKYKTNTVLMSEGCSECYFDCNDKNFKKIYNSLIQSQYNNASFLNIAIRFQFLHNRLYLPFYVLALYASKSSNKKFEIILEYLKFIEMEGHFEYFNTFCQIIKSIIDYKNYPTGFINTLKTRVLSIALDHNRLDLFVDFASVILEEIPTFVNWVNEDKIHNKELVDLLQSELSEKVVEKYINYYIFKKFNDGTLNEHIIDLLSDILYAFPVPYLEEIITNNAYANFNKNYKRDLLINNFDKIISRINENKKAYILAYFVVEHLLADDTDLTPLVSSTQPVADSLIREVSDAPEKLIEIYPYFKIDSINRHIVEEIYCSKFFSIYPSELSVDESLEIIKNYNKNYAFFASVYFIETRTNSTELLSDTRVSELYLDALRNSTNYSKALSLVLNTHYSLDAIDTIEKDRIKDIIRILYSNFKENGISDGAYKIFNETFTLEFAEKICLQNFNATNGTPIILMGIYTKKKELGKVLYLYSIYHDITKTGNRTFYRQLHSSNNRFSNTNTHYKAIRYVFSNYEYTHIFEFLKWAKGINIDKRYLDWFKKSEQHEMYTWQINNLIKNPFKEKSWESIISKLSQDNVRQPNSAFGYAVQCVYLLEFYDFDKSEDIEIINSYEDQLTKFAFFSKPNDIGNFVSLSTEMLAVLSESYAIKLNDFLYRNRELFKLNNNITNEEINKFYEVALRKNIETENSIYLELAGNIYFSFSERINLFLDLYKEICQKSQNKAVLFRILFASYPFAAIQEFHDFLYFSDWNCDNEDKKILALLKIIYSLDDDTLPDDIAALTPRMLKNFKNDVSVMLQKYPKLSYYNSFVTTDEPVGYKYLVLKYVFNVVYDQETYWDFSDRYWDYCDINSVWKSLEKESNVGITVVLDFLKVCYYQQIKYAQRLGVEYTSRRYINMLLIDLYSSLINGENVNDVDDNYINDIMHKNEHVSLIYNNYYYRFKSAILELLNSSLTFTTKKAICLSTIRGTLCPLTYHTGTIKEILQNTEIHSSYKTIIETTGYPSLAQSAIFIYMNNEYLSEEIMSFCSTMIPKIYVALKMFAILKDTDDINMMRDFMALTYGRSNRTQYLSAAISKKNKYFSSDNFVKCKDIIVNTIISTVFKYNILRDIGNMVRSFKVSIDHLFFYELFKGMDCEPIYHYLCAVENALNNHKEKAVAAFYRIGVKSAIPKLWEEEYDRLRDYITGVSQKFATNRISNEYDALKETSIEKTYLMEIAGRFTDEEINTHLAREAYRIFIDVESSLKEKIRAAALVLLFVNKTPSKFYSLKKDNKNEEHSEEGILYVKIETYNEFIFEYSLCILRFSEFTINEKFQIIIEIFENFDLLTEQGKRKFGTEIKDAFIEFFTTSKSYDDLILYDKWISNRRIIDIAENNSINIDGLEEFSILLDKCIEFEHNDYTIMEKIDFLRNDFPHNISVSPLVKKLLDSVKGEIARLEQNVLAKITAINKEIEDNSIFILLENSPNSCVSIDLSPKSKTSKFVVTVFSENFNEPMEFEAFCSGNIDNIRPGQVSGERIALPEYITKELTDGDCINVIITFNVKGQKICDNKKNEGITFIYRENSDNIEIMPAKFRYKTDIEAFTEKNKGFGRRTDKEWLDTYIPIKNLSVIYGPSRVGKSSLLKYIENFLAVDYKHKRGAFENFEKDIDTLYVISYKPEYQNMPEEEKDRLMFLFLNPIKSMFKKIINSEMSVGDKDDNNIPRVTIEQILKILEKPETDLSIEDKLEIVSNNLSKNNCEVWILIDEFQQVLEKWSITQSELFENFRKILEELGESIRYILCGADELVKLMINQDSVFMYGDNTRPIGQFGERDKNDYFDMLRDPMVWGNEKNPFTDEALDYIFSYTGGNALYGKLIGNEIIDAIEKGDFKYRQKLYPFDISSVVSIMLSEQKGDIKATSEVNKFIKNVTKNLEMEEKYLTFIAALMLEEPDRTYVSGYEIHDYFSAESSYELKAEIDTALRLCSVRGILKWDEKNGISVYSFSTPFYFSQYCEIVKRNGKPNRVIITEEDTEDSSSGTEEVWNLYKTLEPDERYEILSKVYLDEKLPKESMKIFKDRIANNYRDIIETQNNNNIQINAQTINTAFSTLISDASTLDRLAAFKTLPKLEAFYTEQERVRMRELQAAKPAFDDESEEYELSDSDVIIIDEIDEINTKAQNRYYGEVVSTMLKRSDSTPNSSVFAKPTDEDLKVVLGIKEPSQLAAIKALPQEYYQQLCFAVALHKMILPEENETIDYSDVDFSPISIMYCKLVEIMLKDKHLKLYGKALPELTITSGENFSTLNKPDILKRKWKDITLGTFVWHLIFQKVQITAKGVHNESYFKPYSDPQKDKMPNLKRLRDYTGTDLNDWKKHAKALAEVVEIRNSSAHGGNAVSKVVFDHLLKVLFTDGEGEVVRIWELYQD